MENEKPILRGELALMAAIVINSFSVVLMLYSGSGISAISSVPYAFSEVFKELSLGTWTYIFQGALVLSLMILRRKFVPSYLFSFVAGFAFSELLDVNELWIGILPQTIPCRIAYFLISYFLLSIGIALENRCQLPIIPTDLFQENCHRSLRNHMQESRLHLMFYVLQQQAFNRSDAWIFRWIRYWNDRCCIYDGENGFDHRQLDRSESYFCIGLK